MWRTREQERRLTQNSQTRNSVDDAARANVAPRVIFNTRWKGSDHGRGAEAEELPAADVTVTTIVDVPGGALAPGPVPEAVDAGEVSVPVAEEFEKVVVVVVVALALPEELEVVEFVEDDGEEELVDEVREAEETAVVGEMMVEPVTKLDVCGELLMSANVGPTAETLMPAVEFDASIIQV